MNTYTRVRSGMPADTVDPLSRTTDRSITRDSGLARLYEESWHSFSRRRTCGPRRVTRHTWCHTLSRARSTPLIERRRFLHTVDT